mgnify:CR=1 FL=1
MYPLFAALLIFAAPQPAAAHALPVQTEYHAFPEAPSSTPMISKEALESAPLSTTTIERMVKNAQQKYNLDDSFYRTLRCESAGFKNIQSQVQSATGPGGKEDSWGVAQIYLPAHQTITRAEALNPHFAVEWAAEQFAAGKAYLWTCYRLLFE